MNSIPEPSVNAPASAKPAQPAVEAAPDAVDRLFRWTAQGAPPHPLEALIRRYREEQADARTD